MKKISAQKVQARLNRVLAASSRKQIEAVKPRRAWSGRISHLDKLLAWMYDKNILNKTDQARKDTLFRSYYRYYNDGEFPRVLSPLGYNKWMSDEKIEAALEELIEEFIKKILSKYAGKYSRKDFRYDQYMEQLGDVIDLIDRSNGTNAYDINYFLSKIANPDEELVKLNGELQSYHKQLITKLAKVSEMPEVKEIMEKNYVSNLTNRTPKSAKDILGKYWTQDLEEILKKMQQVSYKMKDKLLKVREAAKKLKDEGVF